MAIQFFELHIFERFLVIHKLVKNSFSFPNYVLASLDGMGISHGEPFDFGALFIGKGDLTFHRFDLFFRFVGNAEFVVDKLLLVLLRVTFS